MLKIINSFKGLLLNEVRICNQQAGSLFHTTSTLDNSFNRANHGPRKFLVHNKKIYKPQLPDETPRPAVSYS